jgi:hypothetical protein
VITISAKRAIGFAQAADGRLRSFCGHQNSSNWKGL